MASMSFFINDQSTGGSTPVVKVTITENDDGTVTIRIDQLVAAGNYLGDLRGFFMDINEALIGHLDVLGSSVLLAGSNVWTAVNSSYTQGDDNVSRVGSSSNNMNGMLGSNGGFDFGIEIGTEGVGKNGDDVRGFQFTLGSDNSSLTLADFAGVNFGVRITSVGLDTNGDGVIDTSRSGSVKMLEQGAATTGPNAPVIVDDDAFGGTTGGTGDEATAQNTTGTLAHSYSSGSVVLTGAQFASDLGLEVTTLNNGMIVISQLQNGSWVAVLKVEITNAATGAYTVTQLATVLHPPGDDENDISVTIGYDAVSSDGDTASGILSILIDDASVHLQPSTLTGAVTEDATLTASGAVNFIAAEIGTATVDTAAATVTYTPVGGSATSVLLPGLDGAAIRSALTLNASGNWTFDASSLYLDPLDDGEILTVTYAVTVTDRDGDSQTTTITITINGTDDQPTLAAVTSGSIAEVTQTSTLTTDGLAGTLDGDDVDAGETLTYGIDGGTVSADGTTVSLAGTYGTLTVTIATGAYVFVPNAAAIEALDDGDTDSDVFTMTVSDGDGAPVTQTYTVNVTGADDAPISTDGSTSTEEDTRVNGTLPSASDVDGDNISYGLGTQAANGTVVVNADGTFSYTPNVNFNGSDSFTFSISDGDDEVVTYTYSVTVNPVNDAPVNTIAGYSTDEDTAKQLTGLSVADVDAGTGAITVTLSVTSGTLAATAGGDVTVTGSGSGSIQLSGTLAAINAYLASASAPVFTPALNANGDVTLTMTTNDGGNSGSGGALADTDEVTISVAAVNDAPVNTIAGYSTDEDTAKQLTGLSVADVDAGTGAITVTLSVTSGTLAATAGGDVTVTGSGSGSIQLSGTLAAINAYLASASAPVFTPALNANGDVTLTMTTNDGGNSGSGGALADTDGVTISVIPVDDAPVAVADTATAAEDTAVNIAVIGNDTDIDGGPKSVASVTQGANGSVAINEDGTVRYTPNANFNGSDSFTYTLNGGSTATVNVTVNPVDDAPVAVADTASTNEDTPVNIAVIGNDTDIDGGPKSVTSVTQGANGSVAINDDGTVRYTPNANFNGSDSFTYTLNGGSTATVNVTVTPVNDNPDAVNDSASTNEDTPILIDVRANDSDVDGNPLSVSAVTNGSNGAVAINANGTVTYTPNANFNGSDSFTYTVSDGQGGSDTATVNVAVNPVNDAPVITSNGGGATASISIPENTIAVTTVTSTDVDGPSATYSIVGGADQARFTINSATGVLSFVSAPDFENPADVSGGASVAGNNIYDVVVRASDGSLFDDQALAVTITNVNEVTTAVADKIVISSGTVATFSTNALTANDQAQLAVISMGGTAVAQGVVTFNAATQTFTYDTTSGAGAGGLSFTYTLSDNSTATVTIGVVNANPNTFNLTTVDSGIYASAGSYQASFLDFQGGGDTATGGTAPDIMIGGAGDDALNGGSGGDILRGGSGNDTLNGQGDFGQRDLVDLSDGTASSGLTGITFTLVQSSSDTIVNLSSIGLGSDTYRNMEGVIGTNFNDTLNGSSADDELRGAGGNDGLSGNGGADVLIGGDGADTLTGGAGADSLYGGAGNDTFVFTQISDTGDTIYDWNSSDRINVGGLDSNGAAAGDPSFIWGGTTATANGVWYTVVDGNSVVSVDTDGNTSTAELTITVQGVTTLNASDFLLG